MGNCVLSNHVAQVTIEVHTWEKESHGLFDYESRHITRQVYKVKMQDSYLIREANQVVLVNDANVTKQILITLARDQETLTLKAPLDRLDKYQQEPPAEIEVKGQLLSVSQKTMMKSDQREHQDHQQLQTREKGNKVWLVVASLQRILPDQGVVLGRGDIIKLGRIKLRVREINLLEDSNQEIRSIRSEKQESSVCKVCLYDVALPGNPLLNPCKCSGTMKYIHLECLQQWYHINQIYNRLRQKLHSRQSNNCTIYLWKDLSCELCKFQYKPVFESDNVRYDLVELSKPRGVPFVLLELHSKKLQPHQIMDQGDTFTQKACGIYIITFQDKQEVKFGRAHENEVLVSDISVSRVHAQLSLVQYPQPIKSQVNHQLILKDLKSKFGTLMLLKNDLTLSHEVNEMQVQVGRSVMKFSMGSRSLTCCQK